MRESEHALEEKLKHQDEFCDLPGELDDIIRDQVREDLNKVHKLLENADKSKTIAENDLEKVKEGIKGKELLKIPANSLAIPVE